MVAAAAAAAAAAAVVRSRARPASLEAWDVVDLSWSAESPEGVATHGLGEGPEIGMVSVAPRGFCVT